MSEQERSRMRTCLNGICLSRRAVYLLFLIILLFGALHNVAPHLVWGFNTIQEHDEVCHFARAKNIAHGNIDIFHLWDRTDYYNLYPPGLHILEAFFINSAGVENIYTISFIFKFMLMSVILLLYFMIGSKISPEVGLLASFFRGTFFFVRSHYATGYYTNLTSYFGRPDPCMYHEIFILVVIFCILCILKTDNPRNFKNSVLLVILFIASVCHGLTHMGTYISFLFEFPLALFGIGFISHRDVLYRIIKENIMYVIITIVIVLSLPVVFFMYYYPMWGELLGDRYTIGNTLAGMGISPFFAYIAPYICIFIMLSGVPTLLLFRHKLVKVIRTNYIPKKTALLILFSYILLYIIALSIVTSSPDNYHYGTVALEGIFPIFIPANIRNPLVTIPSLIVGFIMFGISVIGLWYSFNSEYNEMRFLGLMYFLLYITWVITFFALELHPSRSWLFRYILPFLYAGCIISLWEREIKIFRVNITKTAVVSIILLLIFTSFIIVVNKEAWVRSSVEPTSILSFGDVAYPQATPEFIAAVDSYVDNEYVLATSETLKVLGATTDAKVLTSDYYTHIKDNKPFGIEYLALSGGRYMDYFFTNYNAKYLVISVSDLNRLNLAEYDKDLNLFKIYEGSYGQSIYYHNKVFHNYSTFYPP